MSALRRGATSTSCKDCRARRREDRDPKCLNNLEQARQLLAEASKRLMQPGMDSALSPISLPNGNSDQFPTMAEAERALILAAYQRSNRRSLEAARLLGIGKTTFYRKLKEIGKRAA
ncbi:MAG TPA: helix-turn-helix domain-containing protein [Alloacidobacterium sp.]|nr:helix-turn-helix domain-containing protein [Alloacidobacterium sp.]